MIPPVGVASSDDQLEVMELVTHLITHPRSHKPIGHSRIFEPLDPNYSLPPFHLGDRRSSPAFNSEVFSVDPRISQSCIDYMRRFVVDCHGVRGELADRVWSVEVV